MDKKFKILITGGAGFIGYYLANYLSKFQMQIYIADNLSRGKNDLEFKELIKKKNVTFIKIDLQKKIKLNIRFTHIFHLAGSVGVKNIQNKPLSSFTNNIITFKNILEFNNLKKQKAKIILFSTSEVYSPLIKNKLIKFPLEEKNNILIENNIIKRDSYYLSKIFNEKLLQLSGTKFLILRPHNIYGPRMGFKHVIPELISKFLNKNKTSASGIKIFSPNHKRSFCYIDDAINQIFRLSFNNKNYNSIYNIGNMKEETKIFDLANMIKEKMKLKIKIKKGPVTEGSPERRVPNMKKTTLKTKIKKFTNIQIGLQKTINWYLSNKHIKNNARSVY